MTEICSDKTGTLTENRMRAECFVLAHGEIVSDLAATEPAYSGPYLRAMALNNDVKTGADGLPLGDPTEIALLQAAQAAGIDRSSLAKDWPRIRDIPFDADRRRMTTIHQGLGGPVAMVKGAPEAVLPRCVRRLGIDGDQAFDRDAAETAATVAAEQGFRVLALAMLDLDAIAARRRTATSKRRSPLSAWSIRREMA